MKYIIFILPILFIGCIGIQNVKDYTMVDGELVCTRMIKARIFGTSGQKVAVKGMSVEKKDSVDHVTDLLEKGIGAGLAVAKGDAT